MHIAETTSRRFGRDTVSRSGGSLEELSEFLHQITPADRIDSNPLEKRSQVLWNGASFLLWISRRVQSSSSKYWFSDIERNPLTLARREVESESGPAGSVRSLISTGLNQPLRCRRLLRSQP